MSDTDPALIPADPAPVGVTPGAAVLAPDPAMAGQLDDAPGCPICGHAAEAHTGGRCLIMLGAFGTEGPCPCPCPEPLP